MKVFCPNCGSDNEGMAGGRVTCRACTASFEVPREPGGPPPPAAGPPGVQPPAYAPFPPQPPRAPDGWAAPPPQQAPFASPPASQPMSGWQPQGMAQVAAPATTNVLAIISLVSGILCCIPLLAPSAAIVLGAVAVKQINESGGAQKGRELAVIGIVLGALGLILNVASIVASILNG